MRRLIVLTLLALCACSPQQTRQWLRWFHRDPQTATEWARNECGALCTDDWDRDGIVEPEPAVEAATELSEDSGFTDRTSSEHDQGSACTGRGPPSPNANPVATGLRTPATATTAGSSSRGDHGKRSAVPVTPPTPLRPNRFTAPSCYRINRAGALGRRVRGSSACTSSPEDVAEELILMLGLLAGVGCLHASTEHDWCNDQRAEEPVSERVILDWLRVSFWVGVHRFAPFESVGPSSYRPPATTGSSILMISGRRSLRSRRTRHSSPRSTGPDPARPAGCHARNGRQGTPP